MNTNRLFRNTLLYTIGNLSIRAVGFVLLPFYTRCLSPEEYGIAEIVELLTNFLALVIGLGTVGPAMVRVYHDYGEARDRHTVVSTTLMTTLGLTLAACALASLGTGYASEALFSNRGYGGLLLLALAGLVLSSQVELCLVYVRLVDKPLLFVLYSVIQTVGMATLNIYFIGFRGLGIWGFVLSKVVVFSAGSIFLLGLAFSQVGLRWSTNVAGRVARFGAPLIGTSIAFFVIHFGDRFFITRYASLEEVGIYSLGYKFGFLITLLVGEPFDRAWNVRLFAYINEPGWQKMFSKVFAYFLLALLLAWTLMSLFCGDLMGTMIGESFRGAAGIVPGVAFAYVTRECGEFFKQILFINKRTTVVTAVAVLAAAVNCLLNVVLIRRYGMYGAMYSTVVTMVVFAVGLYYPSQKEHGIPYRGRASVLAVGLAVAVAALSHTLNIGTSAGSVLVHALLFCAVAAGIWFMGYLTPDEKRSAVAVAGRLLRGRRPAGGPT